MGDTLSFVVTKVYQAIPLLVDGKSYDVQNVGAQEIYLFQQTTLPAPNTTGFIVSPREFKTIDKEVGKSVFVRGNGTASLIKYNELVT